MWKVLDVFVVLTSLWEVMVDILQAIYEEQNGLSAIQGLHSVKSFRIIRLTRLVRTMQFIRVFQFVMALRMLVDSIISTLRSLSFPSLFERRDTKTLQQPHLLIQVTLQTALP